MMRGKERLSEPAWNCFRTEFRRRWRGRSIARALGWLLLITGLPLATSLGAQALTPQILMTPGGGWLSWLLAASWLLSLFSPLTLAFAGGFRSAFLIRGILTLPWLACYFLMPASAASSIAPDREQRRISELILAGLTPQQILIAKGLAAVLPFLAAAVATLVISCAVYPLGMDTEPMSSAEFFSPRLISLSGSVMSSASLILSAAILVCISALSQRTRRAIVICYGYQCVLLPVLSLVSGIGWALALSAGNARWNRFYSFLAPGFTILCLQAVALRLLWPRALRALAYPDEDTGSPPAAPREAS
jgi:hypothetical protein